MREMTITEECTLSAGKNFEHSFGSVQTSKLEMMMTIYDCYNEIRPELVTKLGEKVFFLNFLILIYF